MSISLRPIGLSFLLAILLLVTLAVADSALKSDDVDAGGFVSPEPSAESMSTSQAQVENFWEEAQKLGPEAGQVVLDQVTKSFPSEVASGVKEFKNALTHVMEHARKIRVDIQTAIEKKDITMEHVTDMFSREISGIYDEIKDQLTELMTNDHEEINMNRRDKAKTRAKLIDKVMDKVQAAYIRVLTEVGVPREKAESQSESFFSWLRRLFLILGRLTDKFPLLSEALIFATSMLLLPQISILRPIMTVIGFGPLGPVQGTVAVWAQRMFFGGVIPAGSWFAILQKVGMTLAGSWLEKLVASLGLAALFGFGRGEREEL